jgi:hypothetical protein
MRKIEDGARQIVYGIEYCVFIVLKMSSILSSGRPEFAKLYIGPLIEECRTMYPTAHSFRSAIPRIEARALLCIDPVFEHGIEKFKKIKKQLNKPGHERTAEETVLMQQHTKAKKYLNAVVNYVRTYLFEPISHAERHPGPAFAVDDESTEVDG